MMHAWADYLDGLRAKQKGSRLRQGVGTQRNKLRGKPAYPPPKPQDFRRVTARQGVGTRDMESRSRAEAGLLLRGP